MNLLSGIETPRAADEHSPPLLSDENFNSVLKNALAVVREKLAANQQQEYEQGACDNLCPVLLRVLRKDIEEVGKEQQPANLAQHLKEFKSLCDRLLVRCRPASPEIVAAYLLELAMDGNAPDTIREKTAAISYAHRVGELHDPTHDILVRAALHHINKPSKETPNV